MAAEFSFRDTIKLVTATAFLTALVFGGTCNAPRAPARTWGAAEMALSACEAKCHPKEARIGDFERLKDRNDRWTLPKCYCLNVTEAP